MTNSDPTTELSPFSQQFTHENISVDALMYKIDGNDGWTLEVAVDNETSITWTELFPTDQQAWDDFAAQWKRLAVVGLSMEMTARK